MGRAVYLNKRDARDIRNMDEIFSDHTMRDAYCDDKHNRAELWAIFRSLRVRLDKAGNKTKAWSKV